MGFQVQVIPHPSGEGGYASPNGLVVAGASQAHTAGNVILTQHQVLTVQGATQAQTASSATLAVAGQLPVIGATQAQTASNVTLTQHHVLAVQGATQAHTAGTVTLGTGGVDPNNIYAARAAVSVADSLGFGTRSAEARAEALLGRQVNNYLIYPGYRGTNATMAFLANRIAALTTGNTAWKNGTYTQVMQTPLLMTDPVNAADAQTLAYGASGGYNAHWDAVGVVLNQLTVAQLMRLVMCLGWEHNGEWMPWAVSPRGTANTPDLTLCQNFNAYFRLIVTRVRAQLDSPAKRAALLFEICYSGGAANTPQKRAFLEANNYPGDDVVDIVGSDNYTLTPGNDVVKVRAVLDWQGALATKQLTPTVRRQKMVAVNETGAGCRIVLVSPDIVAGIGRANWAASYAYSINEMTDHDGWMWKALQNIAAGAGTNPAPGSDPTKWQQVYIYRGVYNPATTYNRTNVVTSGGTEWVCRQPITAVTPVAGTYWQRAWESAANDGDQPQLPQMLDAWATPYVAAKLLKHITFFEYDPLNERTYAAVLVPQRIRPGYETTVIPGVTRVANAPTNFPNMSRAFLDLWAVP